MPELNRVANEFDERNVLERFIGLASAQFGRKYDPTTLKKLPVLNHSPQPDFECEVTGEGQVRIEVASLRDPNVVRLVKFIKPQVVSTTDRSLDIIVNKALKAYPSGSPIELLCFSDGLLLSPLDQVLAGARSVDESAKRSFDRAWLLWEFRELHRLW